MTAPATVRHANLFTGTISLGLYLHDGNAVERLGLLRRQATMADAAGFDGVSLSEHHGGFEGYLPVPMSIAALLRRDLRHAWAIACPSLLPLRPPVVVAEHLAWLAAADPGTVGAAFAPGYQAADFDATGSDHASRRQRYWLALASVCALLRGEGEQTVGQDAAFAQCRTDPVPVLSGIGGPVGARRAGAAGAGLLINSHTDAPTVRALVECHGSAGGPPMRMLIRRVWVGAPKGRDVGALIESYRNAGADAAWLATTDDFTLAGSAAEVTDQLVRCVQEAGVTALNLRLHAPGVTPDDIREQIERLGADVLPGVRAGLGWGAAPTAPA